MLGIPGTPSIPGDPGDMVRDSFSGGGGSSVNYAPPPDNSDAMLVSSNNNKTVAEGQIMTQEFAMKQAAMDRELQNTAKLELSLETFDTKLQTAKLDFQLAMKSEEDRHIEKVASNAAQFNQMTASFTSPDLPPPD